MNWTWFHKWTSPRWFYRMSLSWLPWCAGIALICIPLAAVWGLAFAPEDFKQGNSFRIFYVHVPATFLAQSCMLMMGIAGLVSLVWRIKLAPVFIKIAAPFGASITLLALATGAIWGYPTWGTWWEWDARMTSTLVQFFLYTGVIGIFASIESKETAGRAASLMSIVSVVNIPIIKFSVNWWNTLHQPATIKITESTTMPFEMLWPMLVMLVGVYAFFGAVVFVRMKAEIIYSERQTAWVRDMFQTAKT